MKRFLIALLLVTSVVTGAYAKKEKDSEIPDYLIEGAGAPRGGESLVKVSVLVKDKKDATDEVLGKAAVHGVLFRGYSDTSTQGYGGASEHRALAGSPTAYDEHIDFFEPFFSSNKHMDYVRFVDDSRKVVKVDKKYRVSAVVRVTSGMLKKDLQSQKIGAVRGLNSGW